MSSSFLLASRFCQELYKYKKYLEMTKFEFVRSNAVVFKVDVYPRRCARWFIWGIRTFIFIYFLSKKKERNKTLLIFNICIDTGTLNPSIGQEGPVSWTVDEMSWGKSGCSTMRKCWQWCSHSLICLQHIMMHIFCMSGYMDLWIILPGFN